MDLVTLKTLDDNKKTIFWMGYSSNIKRTVNECINLIKQLNILESNTLSAKAYTAFNSRNNEKEFALGFKTINRYDIAANLLIFGLYFEEAKVLIKEGLVLEPDNIALKLLLIEALTQLSYDENKKEIEALLTTIGGGN